MRGQKVILEAESLHFYVAAVSAMRKAEVEGHPIGFALNRFCQCRLWRYVKLGRMFLPQLRGSVAIIVLVNKVQTHGYAEREYDLGYRNDAITDNIRRLARWPLVHS